MSSAVDDDPFDAYRERVERPIWRLFSTYGRPEWRWFSVGVLANLLGRGAKLVPPVILGAAIDGILFSRTGFTLPLVPAGWIPDGRLAQLEFAVAVVAVAFLGGALFTWVWGYTINVFAHRVQHAVRTDTFARMQRLDMTFFDDNETGELLSVLNNDASNLEIFLDNALSNAVRIVLMVAGSAALLLWLNWQLAVVTLAVVPLVLGFTWWFMRAIEPRYETVRSSVGDMNTRLENGLSGIGLVKSTGTEEYENERVTDASRTYYEANMDVLKLSYFYRPGMELLAGLSFAATFLLGGYWIVAGPPPGFSGTLTTGEFVVFVVLIRRFVEPLAQASNIVDQYENARASAERVFGLMNIPVGIEDAHGATTLETVDGHVVYDGVTFAYDDNEPTLTDVDFEVQPGETVALVGPTGAGKSTVVRLLLRLYDVSDGAIYLDGHDIRDLSIRSLRQAIGYVRQDSFLLDGTVAENIRYGRFDASDEAVRAAADAACAASFIAELPDGYETRVGERGVKLSGGQRQRIALARTLLQDPEILILDEATSDVDTHTESLIQASLAEETDDRTTFLVAHRLSTVRDADTILVLDDGRIVERGSHEELLDADGLYADLWRVQAGEADSVPEALGRAATR